jgi:streptogramin lyase
MKNYFVKTIIQGSSSIVPNSAGVINIAPSEIGATGPTGAPGIDGATGPSGGPIGPTGATGATGPATIHDGLAGNVPMLNSATNSYISSPITVDANLVKIADGNDLVLENIKNIIEYEIGSRIFATLPDGTGVQLIGITSDDFVYIPDYQSTTLYKYDTLGNRSVVGTTNVSPARSIFVDTDNRVYTGNAAGDCSRVNLDGTISSFGSYGASSYGIVTDVDGNIYRTRGGQNVIMKIDTSGVETTFATLPGGSNPYGICRDSLGNFYTANFGTNNCSKISPDGLTITTHGNTSNYPIDIVIDSNDTVFIANTNGSNTVTKITSGGSASTIPNISGTSNIQAIAIDSNDNVYICNSGTNNGLFSVTKITNDIPSLFGYTTTVPGQNVPYDITVSTSGVVYTANVSSRTISQIGLLPIIGPIKVLSTDVDGKVVLNDIIIPEFDDSLVLHKTGDEVKNGRLGVTRLDIDTTIANDSGLILTQLSQNNNILFATTTSGGDMVFDSNKNIFLVNQSAGTVTKITPDGTTTVFASLSQYVNNIIIDQNDILYVTCSSDSGDNFIAKVFTDGTSENYANIAGRPYDLVFDDSGNLYVTSLEIATLTKVTPDGTVFDNFVIFPGGSAPKDILFHNGILYVALQNDGVMHKVELDGTNYQFGGLLDFPLGAFVFDSNDNLFVLESNAIGKIEPDGTTTTNWAYTITQNPTDIVIDSYDNLYTVNIAGEGRVTKITPDGIAGNIGQTNSEPISILLDEANGFIYVSNRTSQNVSRMVIKEFILSYDIDGRVIASIKDKTVIGLQDNILANNKINQDLTIDLEYTSSLTIQSDPLTSTPTPHLSMDTNRSMSSYEGPYMSLGIIDNTFSPYGGMYSGFRIGSQGYDYSHFISAHVMSGRSIELEITSDGYNNFNWNSLVPKGYVDESHVSQITITSSTLLTADHHGKTIYIDNGSDNITITVNGGSSDSMYENGNNYVDIFKSEFVQKGTGLVTFTASGVTLNLPEPGMDTIKGKNYRVMLEYQYTEGVGQNQYTLFGDLLPKLILDSVDSSFISWNYPYPVDVEESQDNITFSVYDPAKINSSANDNYYPETWFRLHDVTRNIYSNVIHYFSPT